MEWVNTLGRAILKLNRKTKDNIDGGNINKTNSTTTGSANTSAIWNAGTETNDQNEQDSDEDIQKIWNFLSDVTFDQQQMQEGEIMMDEYGNVEWM